MLRILFYLPAVTLSWFDDAIAPLIRVSAAQAEVHVIVPVLWRGTGVTEAQLAPLADLPNVNWHILSGDDHPTYRISPGSVDELVAFVRQIDPDYVFCRSADVVTPQRFSGKVTFLMEGEFAPTLFGPVPKGGRIVVSGPDYFAFGSVPPLTDDQRSWLRDGADTAWSAFTSGFDAEAEHGRLAAQGLPPGRPFVVFPLQYQGENNFFGRVHGNSLPADEQVAHLAAVLGDDYPLAITVHPMDVRQGTEAAIARIRAMDPRRVRIVDSSGERHRGETTELLIRHCAGLVVEESKSISIGALHGKPILRIARFETAEWVNAYREAAKFGDALRSGDAAAADPAEARLWYAYHYANNAFTPAETGLDGLLARVDRPHDPSRWPGHLGIPAMPR
ncbi:hypothetical protein [Sphingosinicella sp. BN140058]|uniref:hypothetical protein n=1 Tax=Sphingosinicella sp. BN140058 TaxID=1892855 RepID=UPI001010D736|nr:hypothetical protein [Sphingosinicella sp. BN140058]QAY76992.1 hypothetical protein ETR14_11140 [Sphingosinicella sp. BN140058]